MSTPKCTYYIRKDLTTYAPGGTWTYVGYNVSTDAGPWGANPQSPLVSHAPGTVIQGVDDFLINTDNKSFGYYRFNYTLNSSTVSLTVRVIDDTITAGSDKELTLSTADTPANLLYALGASPNGTWTDLNGAGAAFNPTTGILTPTTLTPGNTYRFKYTLTNGYAQGGCQSCPDLETTITVFIAASFSARLDVTDDTCTYTMTLAHPDTAVANQGKVSISADAFVPNLSVRQIITDCNSIQVYNQVVRFGNSVELIIGHSTDITAIHLQSGGFIETLTLSNSAGGTVVIPLAPSGANQAVFAGIGGSTDASALTFSAYNSSSYQNAVGIAIRNYLGTQNFFENIHYKLFLSVLPTFANGSLKIGFIARHQPSTAWLGYNTMGYRASTGAGITTAAINYKFTVNAVNPVTYNIPGCSNLQAVFITSLPGGVENIIDVSTATYNNIPLLSNTYTLTLDNANSIMSRVCNSKRLQAVPLNCSGTVSYLWPGYFNATASVIEVVNKGTYTVSVSCTNPSGTKEVVYVYS
jgi:hypothetical protein